jgi:hypothetical protein
MTSSLTQLPRSSCWTAPSDRSAAQASPRKRLVRPIRRRGKVWFVHVLGNLRAAGRHHASDEVREGRHTRRTPYPGSPPRWARAQRGDGDRTAARPHGGSRREPRTDRQPAERPEAACPPSAPRWAAEVVPSDVSPHQRPRRVRRGWAAGGTTGAPGSPPLTRPPAAARSAGSVTNLPARSRSPRRRESRATLRLKGALPLTPQDRARYRLLKR